MTQTSVPPARKIAVMLAGSMMFGSVVFGQPAVTVSPKTGPPSDRITVSGTAFGPSGGVHLFFDTTELTGAATNASGAFSKSLKVPASATPGEHWVSAVSHTGRLTAQARFKVQTDWAEFQDGAAHHGFNAHENVLNTSNVGSMQLLWSAESGGANSSPVIVNGLLYVGGYDGVVRAFDAQTGRLRWRTTATGSIQSSPAVANGLVYVGSLDNHIYAYDAQTGHLVWGNVTANSIYTPPAVANGMVYVASYKYQTIPMIYAFDAAMGQQIWSQEIPEYAEYLTAPAVSDGHIVLATDDQVYGFNAATGQRAWTITSGLYMVAPAAIENGIAYYADENYYLHAVNVISGAGVWTVPAGYVKYSSPAIAYGMIYLPSYGPDFYAFNATNGQVVWSAPISDVASSPVVANGVVYMAGYTTSLYAADAATGQQLWSYAAISGANSPIVANGMVYLIVNGAVNAFGLPSGSVAAQAAQPPPRPSPARLRALISSQPVH